MKNIPLPFQNLNHPIQTQIENQAQEVTLKKGDAIFTADELEKYVYIVQEGKIKSYQLNLESGKEQIIYIYKKNHIIDTVTILDGEVHEVCYDVLEETKLTRYPIDFIRDLLYTVPEFSRKFYQYIAQQMRYLEETLTDMSLYSTSERLIKLIVEDYNPSNIFRFKILEGLSHTESANLIGTVRHVVERHLRELKNNHIIDIVNRKIKIVETEKLLEKIHLLT
jgi:CRP-like cAMP-binding protein